MRRADVISRQIKLKHLQILVEVGRQGSMVKAGEHLGVSQPVVSKAIADLENSLGVPLLDRLAQGVNPTLYGRALIKRSIAIFDDLRTSVNEIEFLVDPMGENYGSDRPKGWLWGCCRSSSVDSVAVIPVSASRSSWPTRQRSCSGICQTGKWIW